MHLFPYFKIQSKKVIFSIVVAFKRFWNTRISCMWKQQEWENGNVPCTGVLWDLWHQAITKCVPGPALWKQILRGISQSVNLPNHLNFLNTWQSAASSARREVANSMLVACSKLHAHTWKQENRESHMQPRHLQTVDSTRLASLGSIKM